MAACRRTTTGSSLHADQRRRKVDEEDGHLVAAQLLLQEHFAVDINSGPLSQGVPLLRMQADDPGLDGVELMLKGRQMGPPNVFERLLGGVR